VEDRYPALWLWLLTQSYALSAEQGRRPQSQERSPWRGERLLIKN